LNNGRNSIEKQPVQRRVEGKNKGPNAKLGLHITVSAGMNGELGLLEKQESKLSNKAETV
jgi:hypothetical protein